MEKVIVHFSLPCLPGRNEQQFFWILWSSCTYIFFPTIADITVPSEPFHLYLFCISFTLKFLEKTKFVKFVLFYTGWLCVFKRCMKSCLQTVVYVVKYISGILCFPFVVFVIFVLVQPLFFERVLLLPFIAVLPFIAILGAKFSSLSRASVHVDFIALRISFMAPLWASLSECINCPYMIVPYSKFDWINIYIFVQLGQDASDRSYVLVCFFAWGVKESSSSIMIPSSCCEDFFKAITINGNRYLSTRSFVLFITEHPIISFHWVNRNAPFWTPVLEVQYCYLNVYQ